MSNLALLCRRHHRAVHEEGYHVERAPNDELTFRRPDGQPLPDVPAVSGVPADAPLVLRARTAAAGVHIDGRTATPQWLGERLDVVYAIDVLRPHGAARPGVRRMTGIRDFTTPE